MSRTCGHLHTVREVTLGTSGCEECLAIGMRWVHLRMCQTCGHVGCCESQRGHGRSHALSAGHPVIYQMPASSGFIWCYEHRRYVG